VCRPPGTARGQGARWLLQKSRDHLTAGQDIELDEMPAANRNLFVVAVLRGALRICWQQRHPEASRARLAQLESPSIAQPLRFADDHFVPA
jgi:hypothetical protein